MPYPPKQAKAIAASVIRRLGRKRGEAYLHKLKEEAGGHLVDPEAAKKHMKRRKHGRHR